MSLRLLWECHPVYTLKATFFDFCYNFIKSFDFKLISSVYYIVANSGRSTGMAMRLYLRRHNIFPPQPTSNRNLRYIVVNRQLFPLKFYLLFAFQVHSLSIAPYEFFLFGRPPYEFILDPSLVGNKFFCVSNN